MTRRAVAVIVAAGLLVGLAPVVAAAAPASFGTPTSKSTFGTGIVFSQPVTFSGAIGRVELLLTIADAIGSEVVEVPGAGGAGATTLTYTLDTSGAANMIPNTAIAARWRVSAAGDPTAVSLGPELRLVYADDRFTWKSTSSALVRVHWYQGDAAFGAKALRLGEDEVRATSKLLGVTETAPIDFFVYATVAEFYGAIGAGAHENVAGSAYPEIRTMLGLIPPDQIDDPQVAVRIPHEFVHLVFDTASRNPYHSPPRWLNEGLAVHQSEGYGATDRALVKDAAANGTLIPLAGLAGQFPNGNDFFLAYAESVAALDFMIRTYTSDALVRLVRSYAGGRTDDEAFKDALGVDTTAFAKALFASVKATPKERFGPQPAPPGPVPSAWLGAAVGSAPPASQGTATPSAGIAQPSLATGGVGGPTGDTGSGWLGLLAVVALVGLIAVAVFARRRRPGSPPPP